MPLHRDALSCSYPRQSPYGSLLRTPLLRTHPQYTHQLDGAPSKGFSLLQNKFFQ